MRLVPKWEMMEIELITEGEFVNPFLEIEVRAEFFTEGIERTVDGFYDGKKNGGHIWKIRFAPMKEGSWNCVIRSNWKAFDGRREEFFCTQPVSRGGLTIDRRFPNWFAREDGSYQMIRNEGWYPHPCNGFDREYERRDFQQPGENDMELYLQMLADHKINFMIDIGQLYARQSQITDTSFRWPWKVVDPQTNKIDKDFFNLDYYQRMDRFLCYAMEREIFFGMEILYDNSIVRQDEWSHHPLNIKNGGWLEDNEYKTGWGVMFDLQNRVHMEYMERYVRYTVARFGAFRNVVWAIGSEIGNLLIADESSIENAAFPIQTASDWYNYWGEYIARIDAHGRLRSLGDTGRIHEMIDSGQNNFNITQDPRNNYYPMGDLEACFRAVNRFGEDFWDYGKPTVVGEMTSSTVGEYGAERRLYWIGFVSGLCMGRADRHFGPVIQGRLIESEIFGFDGIPVIYDDIRRMADFVESRKVSFWRMRPNDRLLEKKEEDDMIYCLSEPQKEYLIYFVRGGEIKVELPECEFEWYQPGTGESRERGSLSGGKSHFKAPDCQDWVLYIKEKCG